MTDLPRVIFQHGRPGRSVSLILTDRVRLGAGQLLIEAVPKVTVTVHLRPAEVELLAEAWRAADNQTTRCLGCGADLAEVGMSRVFLGGRRYAYTCPECGWIHSQMEER